MSLAQEFDTVVSIADFLSDDWLPEHCDPEKWEKPSTHGIPGVELVGDPHMKLWSDTVAWNNPGRKNFKQSTVIHLNDKIETEGIIPALEPAHAVHYVSQLAPTLSDNDVILLGMSGRGDKDMETVAQALNI